MSDYLFNQLDSCAQRVYRQILSELTKVSRTIKIYGYNPDYIKDLVEKVSFDHPELFYADFHNFTFLQEENYLLWKVHYLFPVCEVPRRKEQLEQAISTMLSMKPEVMYFPEWRKCVWLHNELIRLTEYDESASQNHRNLHAYSAWGALIDRKAVCSGITQAAILLGERIGLQIGSVLGEGMMSEQGQYDDHSWNVVYTNGVPAHLDITWDGNLTHSVGKFRYDYFCIGDGAARRDHRYCAGVVCPDRTGLTYFEIKGRQYCSWKDCQRKLRAEVSPQCDSICFRLYDNSVSPEVVDTFVVDLFSVSEKRLTILTYHNVTQQIYMYVITPAVETKY